jgi:hypothetical protein
MKKDPNDPFANKRVMDELTMLKRKRALPSIDETMQEIARALDTHNTSLTKTEEGKNFIPAEVFWQGLSSQGVVRFCDHGKWSDLDLIFLPEAVRTVRNGSITVTVGQKKVIYTAYELAELSGKKIKALYDPFPPFERAIILKEKEGEDDDWEFCCLAESWSGHGIDPRDQDALSAAMKVKKGYEKRFRQIINSLHDKARTAAGVDEIRAQKRINHGSHISQKAQDEDAAATKARAKASDPLTALRKLHEVRGSR